MSVAEMLVGAGLFASGLGTGLGIGLGRGMQKMVSETRQPITCDCEHNLSDHDPKTGECNVAIEVNKYSTTTGRKTGSEWTGCACKRYVGPMPPDHFYLPQAFTQDEVPEEK